MNQQKLNLTQKQQNKQVGYLGLCFLILILSFSNLQNIFSTLCEQLGYENLGQTAIFCIYAAALCSTPFTSIILKKIGYNRAFVICSLGYVCFDMSGLIMVKFLTLNHLLLRIIVCLAASICGFCSSIIWVAQSGYISQCSSKKNKSKLFALFWSFVFSNQIISNSLGTFVLSKVNTIAYFYLMTSLAFISLILFIFLPKVEIPKDSPQLTTEPIDQLKRIKQIIINKKYKYLMIYFLYPGLSMAFYSTYLYKIIKLTSSQSNNQPIEEYNRRLNVSQGIIFIAIGISQVLSGIIYRKYSHNFSKLNLASMGMILVEVGGILSLICYLTKSYEFCFVCGIIWGVSDIFMQTNTAVIVSIIFKDKVEGFAVNRIFYCIGVTIFLIMNLLMSEVDISIFLIIFIIIQTIGTNVSMNLKQLYDTQTKQYFFCDYK